MPELMKCSYCGGVKPADQFKQIVIGKGSATRHKWKCLACIAVTKLTPAERDAKAAQETAARRSKAAFLQKMRSSK